MIVTVSITLIVSLIMYKVISIIQNRFETLKQYEIEYKWIADGEYQLFYTVVFARNEREAFDKFAREAELSSYSKFVISVTEVQWKVEHK